MLKTLLHHYTYYAFVIICLLEIVIFITSTTYTQLAIAILFYPPVVYFAFIAFPRKASRLAVAHHQPQGETVENAAPAGLSQHALPESKQGETTNRESVGISDINKRAFLKLIGGVGFSLFLFSLFNKRIDGLIPGSIPRGSGGPTVLKDTTGKNIDPAENHPMDGYRISEIDENDIAFYGFINKDGAWFIMKGDSDTGSFRYSRGNDNFPSSWTNREKLKYDYFSNIF